jgi:hypothetical protein
MRASAAASGLGRAGRHQQPLSPSSMNSPIAAARGRDDGEALVGRLHQHVGQAVLVAVGRLLAGQHEQVGAREGGEHLLLRLGAEPGAALGDAQPLGLRLQHVAKLAGTDMLEAPVQRLGQQGQRVQRSPKPFFSTLRPIDRMTTGSAASLPSRRARTWCRRRADARSRGRDR